MNIFKQSIARTRAKLHEANRLAGVAMKQIKAEKEQANANIELLLDEIVAQTGLELTTANLPTILAYVTAFAEDQRRRKEEGLDAGDVEGMKDFPI